MNQGRFLLKSIVRSSPVPVELFEKLLFRIKMGYWPNFKNPKSFSEKLHYRKLFERDQRMVTFSDKIEVRDFVRQRVGKDYLIPLLYEADVIEPEELLALGDNLVVKLNNDSGSVFPINRNSLEESTRVCSLLNYNQDYGRSTNEWWYREIPTRVLVEQKLIEAEEHCPIDYKFFVFGDYFFVEPIRRKECGQIECGFFDKNLEPLMWEGQRVKFRGCEEFSGSFPASETFKEMVQVAKSLSAGLKFMRVDLYSVDGKVYFGEMTSCPSEGRVCLTPVAFEQSLGERWSLPVLLSGDSEGSDLKMSVSHN